MTSCGASVTDRATYIEQEIGNQLEQLRWDLHWRRKIPDWVGACGGDAVRSRRMHYDGMRRTIHTIRALREALARERFYEPVRRRVETIRALREALARERER